MFLPAPLALYAGGFFCAVGQVARARHVNASGYVIYQSAPSGSNMASIYENQPRGDSVFQLSAEHSVTPTEGSQHSYYSFGSQKQTVGEVG